MRTLKHNKHQENRNPKFVYFLSFVKWIQMTFVNFVYINDFLWFVTLNHLFCSNLNLFFDNGYYLEMLKIVNLLLQGGEGRPIFTRQVPLKMIPFDSELNRADNSVIACLRCFFKIHFYGLYFRKLIIMWQSIFRILYFHVANYRRMRNGILGWCIVPVWPHTYPPLYSNSLVSCN